MDFMSNALWVTIGFIFLAAIVAAFVRGIKKDKCLKSFAGDQITLEMTDSSRVSGRFRVETTGFELTGTQGEPDPSGRIETSFILYKHEFANLNALYRFHDQLDEKARRQRKRELERTYHPTVLRKLARKSLNVFRTLRDAILEVINVILAQARRVGPAAGMLTSQDKYVTQMKGELIGSVNTAYEPLLERHIGRKMVLEAAFTDEKRNFVGVLKDYSSDFIELLDVDCPEPGRSEPRKADLVIPRRIGTIRHLAE